MKLQKITVDRAAQIESASHGDVKFKVLDGQLKGVQFQTMLGPVIVEIDSYNVVFAQIAVKKIFYLGFFAKVADQNLYMEREFAKEGDRADYIQMHLAELPSDELTLETREVQDI